MATQLIRLEGSPDVFRTDTGARVSANDIGSLGGFGAVQTITQARPQATQFVQQGLDPGSAFARLSGQSLSQSELQSLGFSTPTPTGGSTANAFSGFIDPFKQFLSSSQPIAPSITKPTPAPALPAPTAAASGPFLQPGVPIEEQPALQPGAAPGGVPTTGQLPQGRTFARIGQDVYETTGGKFNHLTENQFVDLRRTGQIAEVMQLPQLQRSQLTAEQQQFANQISIQERGTQAFVSKPEVKPGIPSGEELTGGITDEIVGEISQTESGLSQWVDQQTGGIIFGEGIANNAFTSSIISNSNNKVYKQWNTSTKSWDVFRLDGTPITQKEFQDEGLNINHVNTKTSVQQLGNQQVEDDDISGFPKDFFTSNNDKLATELAELKKTMTELLDNNPFLNTTISELRATLETETGLDIIKSERDSNQLKINEIMAVYESVAVGIEDSRNLPLKLKSKRLEFLNNKQLAQLNPLIRMQDILDKRYEEKQTQIKDRINDNITEYNIWNDQITRIQSQLNKIEDRVDKVSENAQQTFLFLASNPELMKGATSEELNREFEFIQNNGYLPQSMITRISVNTGKKAQSILQNPNTGEVFGTDGSAIWRIGNIGSTRDPRDSAKITTREVTDPITGEKIFQTIDFTDPSNPRILGSVSQSSGGRSWNNTPENVRASLFAQYISQQGKGLERDEAKKEALSFGLSPETTEIKQAIDQFPVRLSRSREAKKYDNFNSFLTTQNIVPPGTAGSSITRTYNVVGENGSSTRVLTDQQAQTLTNSGYQVTPQ